MFEQENIFPREISYVFVACGYDIELLYSDEDTLIPFEFIRELHNWFYQNAARGETKYIKTVKTEAGETVGLCQMTHRMMPLIVVINIPEVLFLVLFHLI